MRPVSSTSGTLFISRWGYRDSRKARLSPLIAPDGKDSVPATFCRAVVAHHPSTQRCPSSKHEVDGPAICSWASSWRLSVWSLMPIDVHAWGARLARRLACLDETLRFAENICAPAASNRAIVGAPRAGTRLTGSVGTAGLFDFADCILEHLERLGATNDSTGTFKVQQRKVVVPTKNVVASNGTPGLIPSAVWSALTRRRTSHQFRHVAKLFVSNFRDSEYDFRVRDLRPVIADCRKRAYHAFPQNFPCFSARATASAAAARHADCSDRMGKCQTRRRYSISGNQFTFIFDPKYLAKTERRKWTH